MPAFHPATRSSVWRGAAAGARRGALAGAVTVVAAGGLLLGVLEPLAESAGLTECLGPVPTMLLAVALGGIVGVGVFSLAGAAVGATAALRRRST